MLEKFFPLTADQLKLSADLVNTVSKLFVAGGTVSPFLDQTNLGFLGGVAAFMTGIAIHFVALYILGLKPRD